MLLREFAVVIVSSFPNPIIKFNILMDLIFPSLLFSHSISVWLQRWLELIINLWLRISSSKREAREANHNSEKPHLKMLLKFKLINTINAIDNRLYERRFFLNFFMIISLMFPLVRFAFTRSQFFEFFFLSQKNFTFFLFSLFQLFYRLYFTSWQEGGWHSLSYNFDNRCKLFFAPHTLRFEAFCEIFFRVGDGKILKYSR
jgi:hypothetical protein